MRVMVPVREDVESFRAIPDAARLAGSDGEVVLAAVGELAEVSEQAEEARQALAERLRQASASVPMDVPIRFRVELAGDPVAGFSAIAREEQVDQVALVDVELPDRSHLGEALQRELAPLPVMTVDERQ